MIPAKWQFVWGFNKHIQIHSRWHGLTRYQAHFRTFYLTRTLTYFFFAFYPACFESKRILNFYLAFTWQILWHFISRVLSGIGSEIYSDIWSAIPSGILPAIHFDMYSNILTDGRSDVYSHIYLEYTVASCDKQILAFDLVLWHCIWQIFSRPTWQMRWYFSGILFDICSGILFDMYDHIHYDLFILQFVWHCSRHYIWNIFRRPIWHIFRLFAWHSVWQSIPANLVRPASASSWECSDLASPRVQAAARGLTNH